MWVDDKKGERKLIDANDETYFRKKGRRKFNRARRPIIQSRRWRIWTI
jgi:hypothetical protein